MYIIVGMSDAGCNKCDALEKLVKGVIVDIAELKGKNTDLTNRVTKLETENIELKTTLGEFQRSNSDYIDYTTNQRLTQGLPTIGIRIGR